MAKKKIEEKPKTPYEKVLVKEGEILDEYLEAVNRVNEDFLKEAERRFNGIIKADKYFLSDKHKVIQILSHNFTFGVDLYKRVEDGNLISSFTYKVFGVENDFFHDHIIRCPYFDVINMEETLRKMYLRLKTRNIPICNYSKSEVKERSEKGLNYWINEEYDKTVDRSNKILENMSVKDLIAYFSNKEIANRVENLLGLYTYIDFVKRQTIKEIEQISIR